MNQVPSVFLPNASLPFDLRTSWSYVGPILIGILSQNFIHHKKTEETNRQRGCMPRPHALARSSTHPQFSLDTSSATHVHNVPSILRIPNNVRRRTKRYVVSQWPHSLANNPKRTWYRLFSPMKADQALEGPVQWLECLPSNCCCLWESRSDFRERTWSSYRLRAHKRHRCDQGSLEDHANNWGKAAVGPSVHMRRSRLQFLSGWHARKTVGRRKKKVDNGLIIAIYDVILKFT